MQDVDDQIPDGTYEVSTIVRKTAEQDFAMHVYEDIETGEKHFQSFAPVVVSQPSQQGVPFKVDADTREEALAKWFSELQKTQRQFQAQAAQQGQRQQPPPPSAPAPPDSGGGEKKTIDLRKFKEQNSD